MAKDDFSKYIELLSRLDEMEDKLRKQHGGRISCAPGCQDCCGQVLHLLTVEFYYLKAAVKLKLPRAPEHATACPLLSNRQCVLYEHRPVICRTHGMPLLIENDGQHWVDCCPKNFHDIKLNTLPGNSLLHIERVNLLLVAINHVFSTAAGINAAQRLSIADIFNDENEHA